MRELRLHAHLPCLHAELGKRCIATCPAPATNQNQLDCSGARLVVGQLIVQPSFLAEQHVLLRLVDWSQGHPSPLGSGNISLEAAVDDPAHPAVHEAPFACSLALNGRPVGELTGRLHVLWSGTKPTLDAVKRRASFTMTRQKSARLVQSVQKHSPKFPQPRGRAAAAAAPPLPAKAPPTCALQAAPPPRI